MTILYLTNNPRLAGTARILTTWLTLGRAEGDAAGVVLQQSGQLADWLHENDVPHVVSAMPWLERRWPLPALREAWRVARWARARGTGLVHCNEHDVYPFGLLVARFLRVPVVCHVRFRLDPGFARWAFGGWRRPDALLWTTRQQQLDSAEALGGVVPASRQHLIRLGPDPAVFRSDAGERGELRRRFDIRPDEIAIGAATALRPVKRLHEFVELIVALAANDARVVGLIAGGAIEGEEAYRERIESAIAASGLGRRLRWVGHLEPIQPLLGSLDVFVSTSEYETFGNSVCEAMACGVPVAAYVGGSVHEIIGDAGLVVPNGDLAGLIDGVNTLVRNPERRAELGERGRERVATLFNPAASFRDLRAIQRRLIAVR
jgi:glycosyltransferase involved in cell wall biosynthesis